MVEPKRLGGRFKWIERLRKVQNVAILRSTVLSRFAASDGVQHYYQRMNYWLNAAQLGDVYLVRLLTGGRGSWRTS